MKDLTRPASSKLCLVIGFIFLLIILLLDKIYFGRNIIREGFPIFSIDYTFRSIAILVAVILVVVGFKLNSKVSSLQSYFKPLERSCIFLAFSSAFIFLLLFMFNPLYFNILSLEDGIVEWGSAIFLFVSCFVFVASFFKYSKRNETNAWVKLLLLGLALLFFVMGMEEVSWFQRILNIETPALFEKNRQQEMNLHNFAVNYVENAYYFGSFVFLMILSFIDFLFPKLFLKWGIKMLIPRMFLAVSASIAFAFNFDMWNIIYTQIAFFGSIVILAFYTIYMPNKFEKAAILFTIFLIIGTQLIFLVHDFKYAHIWEVTEYKEFLIPLVFSFYSWDVYRQIKKEWQFKET